MHMVKAQMAFQDLTFPLPGQLVKHLPEMPPNMAVEHFPPASWGEYNVVLTLPFRVV